MRRAGVVWAWLAQLLHAGLAFEAKEPLIVISKGRGLQTVPLRRLVTGAEPMMPGSWRCNDNGHWAAGRGGAEGGCVCWEGWAGRGCQSSLCGLHGTPRSLVCGRGSSRGVACEAVFPGRLVTELCVCAVGWEGARCQLPRCFYGERRRGGRGCRCLGNYAPPHCQSCRPGFEGIDCSFPQPAKDSAKGADVPRPPATHSRTSSALALGFALAFLAMLCVAVGLAFRCAAALWAWAWQACHWQSASASASASVSPTSSGRSPPPPLPRFGARVWGGSWCSGLGLRLPSFTAAFGDPPSYQTSLLLNSAEGQRLPPPPPYHALEVTASSRKGSDSSQHKPL